jgi:competence protein ComEC
MHLFGQLSLVSTVTNLFILAVQPWILIFGGVATLIGLVPLLQPLAQVLYWFPWLLLRYTALIVRWTASWPFAAVEVQRFSVVWLLLYYAIVLSLAWAWRWGGRSSHSPIQEARSRRVGWRLLALGAMCLLLSGIALSDLPDGRLHVAFLDVGQGDAILITTQSGQQILLDGGPSPAELTSALGETMPFWDRSIDLVMLTHPDADHITGLVEVLQNYDVGGWMDSGMPTESPVYRECWNLLGQKQIPYHSVRAGFEIALGDGGVIEVLHPPHKGESTRDAQDNENSVVARLVLGNASFLLTGDIEAEEEKAILDLGYALDADVLKVAHHGSGGSSTEEFLSAVAPSLAIISVGRDNRFGHPSPDVMQRLDELGHTSVHRTDQQGTIEIVTDGLTMQMHTKRNGP